MQDSCWYTLRKALRYTAHSIVIKVILTYFILHSINTKTDSRETCPLVRDSDQEQAEKQGNYHKWIAVMNLNPYPTAFPYGNGMVLHFYQQQESSTTKTVHKVINKRLKAYV